MALKLERVVKSPAEGKKHRAIFSKDGRETHTDFGSAGMSDYTIHHDPERRARYLNRHRDRENWNDPTSAGSLSRWLLWGPTTSLNDNIRLFRRRFDL